MKPVMQGDYVLASKWQDGDSKDPWCVGFYDRRAVHPTLPDRHLVVGSEGRQFRASGFRRVKKITAARGKWLLENSDEIETSGRSVWGWVRKAMQPKGTHP